MLIGGIKRLTTPRYFNICSFEFFSTLINIYKSKAFEIKAILSSFIALIPNAFCKLAKLYFKPFWFFEYIFSPIKVIKIYWKFSPSHL